MSSAPLPFAFFFVALALGCGGRADEASSAGPAGSPSFQPIAGAPGACAAHAPVSSDIRGTRVAVPVVASDDASVYWIRSGPDGAAHAQIVRAPRGGGSVTVLVSGVDAQGLAVDEASVYWVDRTGVVSRVAKSGGDPSVLVPAEANYRYSDGTSERSSASNAFGLVREGTDLFWLASVTNIGSSLLRIPTSGGDVVPVAYRLEAPVALTVDASRVYWVEGGNRDSEPGIFQVERAKGHASVSRLASGETFRETSSPSDPRFLLVNDASAVYWLSHHDATVVRIDKASGHVTPIATDVGSGVALAVGDGAVYFAQSRSGKGGVSRVAVTGGAVETILSSPASSLGFGASGLVALGDDEVALVGSCR